MGWCSFHPLNTKLQPGTRSRKQIVFTFPQNSSDLENLPGLSEDLEQQKQIVAQSFTFRAHRAFYLAESYSEGGKLAEAMVLYDRAIEHITQASKLTVESSHAAKEVRICVCCSWYVELFDVHPQQAVGWLGC